MTRKLQKPISQAYLCVLVPHDLDANERASTWQIRSERQPDMVLLDL